MKKARFLFLHPEANAGKVAALDALLLVYIEYLKRCVEAMLAAHRFTVAIQARRGFFPPSDSLSSQIAKLAREQWGVRRSVARTVALGALGGSARTPCACPCLVAAGGRHSRVSPGMRADFSSWTGTCTTATARRTPFGTTPRCSFARCIATTRFGQRRDPRASPCGADRGDRRQSVQVRRTVPLFLLVGQGSFYPAGSDGAAHKVGAGAGVGYNINVAWNGPGYGDGDYMAALDRVILPVARAFKPDLVLISAGFDSADGASRSRSTPSNRDGLTRVRHGGALWRGDRRPGDPLGQCKVSPLGYAHMTAAVMGLVEDRVAIVLEGGYSTSALRRCAARRVSRAHTAITAARLWVRRPACRPVVCGGVGRGVCAGPARRDAARSARELASVAARRHGH